MIIIQIRLKKAKIQAVKRKKKMKKKMILKLLNIKAKMKISKFIVLNQDKISKINQKIISKQKMF